MELPELYTAEQIAKKLNVSTDTVFKWCKRGHLEHIKMPGLRGSVRIALSDVQRFLDSRRVTGGSKGQGPPDCSTEVHKNTN